MSSLIPLSHPDITEREIQAVVDTMRTGRLSNGPRQARFEEMVAQRAGRSEGIALSSGTAGLHLLLRALDIGPGDEVITTPFSCVALANCILFVGAKPVFVDIDPRSLNIDPARVEGAITPRTRAIIAVEVFGNATHVESIEQIAQAHDLDLIEDCREALGGVHLGRPVGSFGRAGVFGFYPNKQITTGEGGMIVCDDQHLADLCRSMRNQGRACRESSGHADHSQWTGGWLAHERLGYNYRLSELAAALGIVQMERLDEMLTARRKVATTYMSLLMDFQDLILPDCGPDDAEQMSWFAFVVRLNDLYGQAERDRIIEGLRRHDIGAANYFPCVHLQPYYREQFGHRASSFPIAESVSQRTVALPFFNQMDDMAVELIVQTLKIMLQREQLLKRN